MFPNVISISNDDFEDECSKIVLEFNAWQEEETLTMESLLPIMHITSEVEQVFSFVNVTKHKRRNRMKTKKLEALMPI